MKCIPSTLSGRFVAAPSIVIEIDEVFDARMHVRHASARRARRRARCFASTSSTIASTTKSASASASSVVPAESRPSAASRSAAVSLPFSTNFAEALSIVAARAIEHRLRDVDEPHVEARLREHLGDPVAHRARADDADGFHDHMRSSSVLAFFVLRRARRTENAERRTD